MSDVSSTAQPLGKQMVPVPVPGLNRPNGKPRDSGGQQQESTSNLPDVDTDPNQDTAIVPYNESGPGGHEDAAAAREVDIVEEKFEIELDTDKVSLQHCILSTVITS